MDPVYNWYNIICMVINYFPDRDWNIIKTELEVIIITHIKSSCNEKYWHGTVQVLRLTDKKNAWNINYTW